MLKIIALFFDILALFFVILSPVTVIHWLLRLIDPPAVKPYYTVLTPFIDAFTQTLDLLFHVPHITYQGNDIPITQGILAFVFTALFFVNNFIANLIKRRNHISTVRQEIKQEQKFRAELSNQQEREKQAKLSGRKMRLMIKFSGSDKQPTVQQSLATFPEFQGKLLHQTHEGALLEFEAVDSGMTYCQKVLQEVRRYYSTLRPMDEKPPFYIVADAPCADTPLQDTAILCEQLIQFCAQNQVIFTSHLAQVLDYKALDQNFKYQSSGLYNIPQINAETELFKLIS
jgi:hypothetical protein